MVTQVVRVLHKLELSPRATKLELDSAMAGSDLQITHIMQ